MCVSGCTADVVFIYSSQPGTEFRIVLNNRAAIQNTLTLMMSEFAQRFHKIAQVRYLRRTSTTIIGQIVDSLKDLESLRQSFLAAKDDRRFLGGPQETTFKDAVGRRQGVLAAGPA